MAISYREALNEWGEEEVVGRIEREFDEAITMDFIGKPITFAIPFPFVHTLSIYLKVNKLYNDCGWKVTWSDDYSGIFTLSRLDDN